MRCHQVGAVHARRNATLDDSVVHWHCQIKACVGGVAASVTGPGGVCLGLGRASGPAGGGPRRRVSRSRPGADWLRDRAALSVRGARPKPSGGHFATIRRNRVRRRAVLHAGQRAR
ncbi:MAG: ring-opening amidohydrolase [Nocardioidaceae bacterium]